MGKVVYTRFRPTEDQAGCPFLLPLVATTAPFHFFVKMVGED
jgi:hypothetical protein